ncbi:MAG: hypothetical protein RLY78_2187 [Pseudomonadota bacterium]
MLPQGFLQDLLSRVDIVDVVGPHVELKKAGINHKGLCPFHGEKSPSFIVSPSRQTYHCFGCGAHGDALRFLTEHHGMAFMDAVRDLAQQVGMQVPERDMSPQARERQEAERAQRATLTDVLDKAATHYRAALKASPRAIGYLKKRGLTGAVAARFGLGYAPEGWRTLAGVFPRYDDPLLVDGGLVIAKTEDGADGAEDTKRYDRFRDRIMFPIRSVQGDVIGFGGRVLDQGEPKYLNSPETPVFHKGQELYGLFEARQGLRQKGYALVVEGYMDVVALAQSGFPNAVATLGTACTAEHVAKLLRFTDSVVFSFDGDAAGRRAAGRALEAALPHASDTRTLRFLFLPTEHDPDSYVRELGAEAFDAAIAQAVPLSAQLIAHAAADADLETAEGRSRMLAQAGPLVALLPEGLLREQVVIELAQRGGIDVETLRKHWERQAASRPGVRTRSADEAAGRQGAPARPAGETRDAPPDVAGGWMDEGGASEEAAAAAAWSAGIHGGASRGDGGQGPGRASDGGQAYGYGGQGGYGGGQGGGYGGGSGWNGSGRSNGGRWNGGGRGDGRRDGGGRGPWRGRDGDRARYDPMAGPRQPPPATATLLDRCAWLLARHTGLWLAEPLDTHEFLAAQPLPYGRYFGALERIVHDLGPVTREALFAAMLEDADDADVLQPLLARLGRFHDVEDDEEPALLLAQILQRLHLHAVQEEMKWLLESGDLSEAAARRQRELIDLTKALKAGPPASSERS